jgi:hypothetical protein
MVLYEVYSASTMKGRVDHICHLGGMIAGIMAAQAMKQSDKRQGIERKPSNNGSALSDISALMKTGWNGLKGKPATSRASGDRGVE